MSQPSLFDGLPRAGGLLLPLFSLPSPYGVGSLGAAAVDFLDLLAAAGQSWWQLLPLGPTGCGDSPYQSFCSQAGNPWFIDLDLLVGQGWLSADEVAAEDWGPDPARIDYGRLYQRRLPLLWLAFERAFPASPAAPAAHRRPDEPSAPLPPRPQALALAAFRQQHSAWLEDYALFMAIRQVQDQRPWYQWPEPLRLRRGWALQKARQAYSRQVDFHCFLQYLFDQQWRHLRQAARERGIRFLGDLPIYCALDSADVWAHREQFQLDALGRPLAVAGVPPDAFSDTGQLWGNPLYDWQRQAGDGFSWWQERLRGVARLFDAVRLDHFRGFEAYWAVDASAADASGGHWRPGPGADLLQALQAACPDLLLVAEDLGYLTPAVGELRRRFGLPGMKVLQFAFDAAADSPYLPHEHAADNICYTGTHDNPPLRAWLDQLQAKSPAALDFCCKYLDVDQPGDLPAALIRAGLASVCRLSILPVADVLGLDAAARINTPGTLGGNWQWRLTPGQFTAQKATELAQLMKLYGRA